MTTALRPRLWGDFLNCIFPRSCELCESNPLPELDLCASCFDSFEPVEEPMCPRCGEVIDGAVSRARACPNCHNQRKPYDFARAGFRSHHGSRELIHRFKYARSFHLGRTLAHMAYQGFQNDPRFAEELNWIVVPVPLHTTRRRKRGFNQANEIAHQLAKLSGLRKLEVLKRTRPTQTQTKLSRRQRQNNLRGAFTIRPTHLKLIENQPILLVDDVFTTGSTIEECARILRSNANPTKIAALTPLRA